MADTSTAAAQLARLLDDYQEVVRRGDRAGFARIFHPSATVSYPQDAELVTVSASAFGAEVADLVEAGTVVDERTKHLEITVAGKVAVMRVDFALQIGDEHFTGTDLYTLALLDGVWRITQKIYDMATE